MDHVKIGKLIAQLRKERGLTQKNMADALNISNKTVSKWECGLGAPDISLWSDLSTILGADIHDLMEGEMTINQANSGNMSKVRFYVCPTCQNMMVSTGGSSNFCCSRKLEQVEVTQDYKGPALNVDIVDIEYSIIINHEMTRDHYILFTAYVKGDRMILNRLYPEQEAMVRLPYMRGGEFYIYCTQDGLSRHLLNM